MTKSGQVESGLLSIICAVVDKQAAVENLSLLMAAGWIHGRIAMGPASLE
jgi:hypothetical protein